MNAWYYVRDGQQTGPVETPRLLQMLASGEVRRDELVWKEGMANWAEAQSVQELNMTSPPPVLVLPAPSVQPSAPYTRAPLPEPAFAAYAIQAAVAPQTPRRSLFRVPSIVIALIVILLHIGGITYAVVGTTNAPKTSPVSTKASPPLAAQRSKSSSGGNGEVIAGLALLGGWALALVGLILGIVGLVKKRDHPFNLWGVIINGGILLLVGIIFLVAMA